jgi:Leucine-rich repeat (LRR) protein
VIPESIAALTKLEEFDISRNDINNVPDVVVELPSLTRFNFHGLCDFF